MVESDYIQLFYLRVTPSRYDLIEMPLKEWKHVEVTYEGLFDTSLIKAMGIHAVETERRSMEDIRYDYPYTTTQVSPCNFFITLFPFFFRFFLALILFTSLMSYPTQE